MTFKPVETELGIIHGRDAIYLDEIRYDYGARKVTLCGEFNGALCGKNDGADFMPYELTFEEVCWFNCTELDVWSVLGKPEYFNVSSYGEVLDSEILEGVETAKELELGHFFVQTYDDVIEIACARSHLKLLGGRRTQEEP